MRSFSTYEPSIRTYRHPGGKPLNGVLPHTTSVELNSKEIAENALEAFLKNSMPQEVNNFTFTSSHTTPVSIEAVTIPVKESMQKETFVKQMSHQLLQVFAKYNKVTT